jgi:membrane protease YdiL (CAAX protease family)
MQCYQAGPRAPLLFASMTIHLSLTALVQRLLFLFLLVIAPAWDYYDTARLKAKPSSTGKIRYYKTLCLWLWGGTVLACLAVGWRPLFTINPAQAEMSWILLHAWVRYLVIAVIIAIFLLNVLFPAAIVFWKKLKKEPRKYSSAEAFEAFNYFFPATWEERRWFAFVCITAGVCEEFLFRGFYCIT